MTRSLTAEEILAPQPDPVATPASTPVLGPILAYLRDLDPTGRLAGLVTHRLEQGLARYGVPLVTHTGRDYLLDAAQELVDAAIYLAAHRLENGEPLDGVAAGLRTALVLADQSRTARGTQPPHTPLEILDAGRRALGYPVPGQDPRLGPWQRVRCLDGGEYCTTYSTDVAIYTEPTPRGWVVQILDETDEEDVWHEVRGATGLADVTEWLRAREWVLQ